MPVLHHAAITDLGKPEDALDDEGMLDLSPHTRLSAVLLLLPFSESLVANPLLVSEVTRLRCDLGDQLILDGVGRVAIYQPLVDMQQLVEGGVTPRPNTYALRLPSMSVTEKPGHRIILL